MLEKDNNIENKSFFIMYFGRKKIYWTLSYQYFIRKEFINLSMGKVAHVEML